LSNNSKEAQHRAAAEFKKVQRAKEGAKAMSDYEAAGHAIREKTSKLRALRLAKEAADKEAKAKTKAAPQSKKPST
jgi:formate-dependent nitrite reductase cytochrome c552 subunit